MYKVKEDFLWFKKKQELTDEEVQQNWIKDCLVEKIVDIVPKEKPKPKLSIKRKVKKKEE